ncbi:MAG: 2-hydroxyacid dehydrogenase [Thermoplasmataceae archaeon]
MKILIVSPVSLELKGKIRDLSESMGLTCEFSDDIKNWEDFDVALIGHEMLKQLNDFIPKMKKLSFIQTLSAGVDMIDFRSFPKNILLCSNANAYSRPVAEHAISMALALRKNLMYNHIQMEKGMFNQMTENRSLQDAKVGIIGYGGIGKEIGKFSMGLGMKVLTVSRSPVSDRVEFSGTLASIDHVLSESDILFITIPLNMHTRNLINKDKLQKMKKDAILINVARAEIINEKDLYDHLKENPRFNAGTDVWWTEPMSHGKFDTEYPFFELVNFLGSPHNSAIVPNVFEYAFKSALNNIKKWSLGEKPSNIVNVNDYI